MSRSGPEIDMRRIIVAVCALLVVVAGAWVAGAWAQQTVHRIAQTTTAQETADISQTPRQALIEMFFSKTPGDFVKHLPMATRTALEKSGNLAALQGYSLLVSQLQTQTNSLQTFETGPVLFVTENQKTGQKVEVTVASEAMRGDRDDIELSVRVTKNGGEAQQTPFMPQMTFSMKQESQLWTLNEISVTVHVPLADPDFLKAITEKMKPTTTSGSFARPSGTPGQAPGQTAGSDTLVLGAMRTILTAEVTYFSTYPTVGFTCTLSNLDGFGGGQPNEHQAMLINSGLASGKRYGFVFTLSGCGGPPATSFHLTAVPNETTIGRKVFCADQSAVIRSSDDGKAATCMASGTPVQ
jgi:type IV pilus assembly protein PilA